jgi:hypothetical protein
MVEIPHRRSETCKRARYAMELLLFRYHDGKSMSLSPCGTSSTIMSAPSANAGEFALIGFRSKWEKT